MRLRSVLISLIPFFLSSPVFGQGLKSKFEIKSGLQWDGYPSFKIQFNSVTNSTIKLQGISWGVGVNYKHFLKKQSFIKTGLGYYKYTFNKIQNYTSPFGNTSSRRINYTGGSSTLAYVSNKYWYNTVAATIGFERLFELKKRMNLTTGIDAVNYYTFSQGYNIPTSTDIKYKRDDGRYFGFSLNLYADIQKKFNKFSLGPIIDFPIFEMWKQDAVFPGEQSNKSRTKWLRGIGMSLTCIYSLTKQ